MTKLRRGVWLSNEPLTINEGAEGDTLLCVTLKCKWKRIEGFEVVELGKPYREWIIPTGTLKPIISTIEVVDDSNLER
jgi:hypothetical protein